MPTYTVPDNPADPEHTALELIVRLPADVLHTTAFTTVLQDYLQRVARRRLLRRPRRGTTPARSPPPCPSTW